MALKMIERFGILPLVVIDDAERAPELAASLISGGLACAEIALRTECALSSLAAMASAFPHMLLGAGTVLRRDDVDRAADAGARFIVSPGFDADIVERAVVLGLDVIPGVATATELQRAAAMGISHVKLFPASSLGGLDTITALSGPFPDARFMPSGGVTHVNARHYLASKSVFAVSGTWMVPRQHIAAGNFSEIEALTADAATIVRSSR